MLIPAAAEVPEGGVSLSVKLGLFATTALLVAASVAFWQLQVRSSPARAPVSPMVSTARPASASAATGAITTPTTPAAAVELPPSSKPAIAPSVASSEKPEPLRRPAPANWPAPRKPVPFSAGSRYGL